nr:MAG TPA: hypothetical protein [Caudoviricetes sp.]
MVYPRTARTAEYMIFMRIIGNMSAQYRVRSG